MDGGSFFSIGWWLSSFFSRFFRFFHSFLPDNIKRQQGMYAVNPVCIPRNHLVEEAISAAENHQDFEPFNRLVDILTKPFEFSQINARYATPPRPEQVVRQTFCGT